MDFLLEFIFEAILEGIFGITLKNPKVKTWAKTMAWLLMAESVPIVLGISSVSMYRIGRTASSIGGGIFSVLLAIGFLILGMYGHQRNWKHEDE